MALLPVRNSQTDFSSLSQRWVFVRDNNNVPFLVDTRTQRRYRATGTGQLNALQAMFGPPITGTYLTGYEEPGAVVDAFGGPDEMERVAAGHIPNPLTGEFVDDPISVRSERGDVYEARHRTNEPDLGQGETPDVSAEPVNYMELAKSRMPWMPDEILQQYADAWTDNQDLAISEVRQSQAYKKHFAGNIRDDGSVRMSEKQYMAGKHAYADIMGEYGIPASEFEHRYADLVSNDVSMREFQQRMDMTYQQVLSQGDEVRRAYANFYSGDISDASILASALEPGTNPLVFEQRFRAAQIGAEAGRYGFDVVRGDAERLARHGLDRQAGRQFYSRAKGLLPTIGTLIQRHQDPDDEFDLRDLEEALILSDPDEMGQIERLFAQESSTFSPTSGTFRSGQFGVSGLRPR